MNLSSERSLCGPANRERRGGLVLAFPVLDRGSGPREHDVFILDVLPVNGSLVSRDIPAHSGSWPARLSKTRPGRVRRRLRE